MSARSSDIFNPHAEEPPKAASRSMVQSTGPSFETRPPGAPQDEGRKQVKREKRDVSGWIVLDKPVGMTSTHAVARVKRAFSAKKAGHAGTLDPLASGLLPIALGEATKTVPFVMDGRKRYRFTVRWGIETDTDDSEGRAIATSEARPDADAIRAALPRFTGTIEQVPPKFSAIKIDGERAYDLAREGEEVELAPRTIEVHQLALTETPDADHAVFEAECGKGTYVRALARDLGRTLGSAGHVVALQRTMVGPFSEAEAVGIEELTGYGEAAAVAKIPLPAFLLGVETALQDLPAVNVSSADAARLARGQPVLVRGRDAPMMEGWIAVSTEGALIALAMAEKGELHPRRIFNLRR
jgi:tRNA pseudouridine55 synthase